ncbi:hypothetical protein Tco_1197040, partial [Tanacetum coccineum]
TVMSDYEDSTVTYTAVSSSFGGLSDIGSPGVVRLEHEGLPWMLDEPYVQSPPPPDFVPEPVYLDFMPLEDEILPVEEQPLPAADSPTANSPGYIPESDPKEDPEEDDDEDPEEDPADYPVDGGDDDDDEDEPFDDDADEEVDDKKEEHLALADSTAVALPTIDQAPSAEETEPFETDESAATPPPHPACHITARISIPAPVPTPISSPLLPPILSPLLVSSPIPVLSPSPPASLIRPLGYRAVMIRLRTEATSTSHSLPLPSPIKISHTRPDAPSSGTPPLHLLSTDRRADRPEVTLPPQKRLGIALGLRYEVGESSSAAVRPTGGLRADYGFVATMNKEIRRDLERDVGYGITNSWDEIVEAMDRRAHARTARLMETEARTSQEAWGRSMDTSDLARAEVMLLRAQVVAQQAVITELQAADRRRHAMITEMLTADHKRQKQFIEALKLLKRL